MDIYRTHEKEKKKQKYTFFSSTHGTISERDHILGHRTSLNKFKRIEFFQPSVLTTVVCTKKEINHRKKSR